MLEEHQTKIDKPIGEVTIRNKDYNIIDRILRRPKQRTFTLYKCRVCNMERSAEIAYRLPELQGEVNTLEELTGKAFPLLKDHAKDLVYLLACFIQNNSKEPKKSLVKFIRDNIDGDELFDITRKCLTQSGLMSFINATLLVKGTNVKIAEEIKEKDAPSAITQV